MQPTPINIIVDLDENSNLQVVDHYMDRKYPLIRIYKIARLNNGFKSKLHHNTSKPSSYVTKTWILNGKKLHKKGFNKVCWEYNREKL